MGLTLVCLLVREPSTAVARDFEINGLPTEFRPSADFYPQAMRRKGIAGRVSLAYSIDGKGRAQNIVTLASDDAGFESAATSLVRSIRFKVPDDWTASGHDWRRYRIQVNFRIEGMANLPTWEEGGDAIIVTAGFR